MKPTLLAMLVSCLGLLPVQASANEALAPTLSSGLESGQGDSTVRAQDDFFRHINGTWLKNTTIPADRAIWGGFHQLRDSVQTQLRAIIETAAAQPAGAAKAETRKVGDFYASFMDEKKIAELGINPLKTELAQIAAVRSKADLPRLIGYLSGIGVNTPYAYTVVQDNKDSTRYVVNLAQAGLGMPNRDYYLKPKDAALSLARAKYQAHIETLLTLAGQKDAASKAHRIVALETRLAQVQWSKVENRDPVRSYNKVALKELDALTPGYQWQGFLQESGIGGKTEYVIVSQPSYLKGFAKLVQQVPLADWKAYFELRVMFEFAELLPQAYVDADFAFRGQVLSGAKENRPRWKRGVALVNTELGESIGKIYVEQHFSQNSKRRMETMV
ncbi:MAG: hypothetical protein RL748_241, partial [Pseudomonadota bacterium]